MVLRILILSLLPTIVWADLIENTINQARYDQCIARWPSLASSYFVLTKEEACERYAKVNPTPAIATCADQVLGNPPGSRDYYTNYEAIAKLCQQNPEMTSTHQTCVRQKIRYGGDVVEAYNRCDPPIRDCLRRLNQSFPASANSNRGRYHYEICFSNNQDQEFTMCAARIAKRHNTLLSNKFVIANLCYAANRPCVASLRSKVTGNVSLKQLRIIERICSNKGDNSQAWADCSFEEARGNTFTAEEAVEFCAMTNANARTCVKRVKQLPNSNFEKAKRVCRVANENARQCLEKYIKKENPFHQSPLKDVTLYVAEQYCQIEQNSVKTCAKAQFESTTTESQAKTIIKNCRTNNTRYTQCLSLFTEYFPSHYPQNTTTTDGEKICALSSSEMRTCMLNSIMKKEYVKKPTLFSGGNTWFPYREYLDKCLARFLGFLLEDMNLGQQWACRYNYFHQMSLYDRAADCTFQTDRSICRELRRQIDQMTNTQLQPSCNRFNLSYDNLDNTNGNHLFRVCRQKSLVPSS